MADQEAFRASGEQHLLPTGINGCASGSESLDRLGKLVQGIAGITSGVLDGEAGYSRSNAKPNAFPYTLRVRSVARLKISINGKGRCSNEFGNVLKYEVARQDVDVVRQPARKPKAGASCCKRLETKLLKIPCGTDVPRIGNNEATPLMKASKYRSAGGDGGVNLHRLEFR